MLFAPQSYHRACQEVTVPIPVLWALKIWKMQGNLLPLSFWHKYLHRTKMGALVPPPMCIRSHWSENTLTLTSPIYFSLYALRNYYDYGYNSQRDMTYSIFAYEVHFFTFAV